MWILLIFARLVSCTAAKKALYYEKKREHYGKTTVLFSLFVCYKALMLAHRNRGQFDNTAGPVVFITVVFLAGHQGLLGADKPSDLRFTVSHGTYRPLSFLVVIIPHLLLFVNSLF